MTHGTRAAYRRGCRCVACRAANAAYRAARAQADAVTATVPTVPASPARDHLNLLRRAGWGTRSVARACGVARSQLCLIATGRARHITADTAAAILGLPADRGGAPKRRVASGYAWRLVARLEAEGFTRAEIARRLGLSSPQLQWDGVTVSVRTVERLQKLVRYFLDEDDAA